MMKLRLELETWAKENNIDREIVSISGDGSFAHKQGIDGKLDQGQ